jgi:exocyst complex component 3
MVVFFFSLKWIEESFAAVPEVYAKLQDVREENMRHSQYVTAMENLKHIFTVPESVEKTKQWISEGKLLHTHQVRSQPKKQYGACTLLT